MEATSLLPKGRISAPESVWAGLLWDLNQLPLLLTLSQFHQQTLCTAGKKLANIAGIAGVRDPGQKNIFGLTGLFGCRATAGGHGEADTEFR